jgi:c-di-AMP phosphodiesterase-like protein
VIIIKKKGFNAIIIMIILIYICSYYVANSGYYEYHLQERTYLTNEKIKEFERDVKNNENIDVKDYLVAEEIDYTNNFTNLIYNMSYKGNNLARKILKRVFRRLHYLLED